MTSATIRRVAKLEGALLPPDAVLLWLAEAQQFPSLVEYTRSIIDLPVEAAPLSVISARVDAAVREASKGHPRDAVETAARRAQGDAVFLFCLVFILNGQALEVARIEGLRSVATFWWMGALLGGPHEAPTSDQDAREQRDAWRLWRTVVDRLISDVRVETEARVSLERRYLGGHDALFSDVAAAWAGHVDAVERLGRLAAVIESARLTTAVRRKLGGSDSLEGRVGALASRLADDARVKAYEILGQRERAVAIMERRLRLEPGSASRS
jgi:hypothetical protein